MPSQCPFCQQPAKFSEVGSNVDMDCETCQVHVRFVWKAVSMECLSPAATLKYIRSANDRGIERPFVTLRDMQR